jgi:hypothetical protein
VNEGEIIFAVGAFIGAVGSLWFIAASLPRAGTGEGLGTRKIAMMLVLAVYGVMALAAVILGVVLQDAGVAGSAGLLLLLAIAGFALVWQSDAV